MERFDVVVVGAGKTSLHCMIGGFPRVWALGKSSNQYPLPQYFV